MSSNVNPGYAFPLEKLGSDIARNQFNYESILNGLIAWDKTTQDEVTIRLTMGTDPWYWDYRIPSKKALLNSSSFDCAVEGPVVENNFSTDCRIINTLYGGSRQINQSTFDADTDVNTGTDYITFDDVTGWIIGDELKLEKTDVGDILPTPLAEDTIYKIFDISGNDVQLSDLNDNLIVLTATGSGIIKAVEKEVAPSTSTTDPGDVATLRMSVTSSGSCDWSVNYIELVNDWTAGSNYRWGNLVKYNDGGGTKLYRAVFDIENAQPSDTPDTSINWDLWVVDWMANIEYPVGTKVAYLGTIYTVIDPIDAADVGVTPDNNTDDYEVYAEAWESGKGYKEGAYVAYNYLPYIAQNEILDSASSPDINEDWFFAVTERVPSSVPFNNSAIFQWQLNYDVEGFILRCLGPLDVSEPDTNINFRLSARNIEPASIYQRSVETFSTSNYAFWPNDLNSIWEQGTTYGPTDTGIGVNNRQNYSAVMVFDHTRQDIAKTVNFVNYDGPDLDKGLCVYLPVEVNVGDGGIAYPEDGFTFEFYFRIWPNAQYTNSTTRDHIINKAQIYVYNVLNAENVKDDTCSSPVAKFSMARTTNFYMFGENVSIPDKPVHYRATFIYDATAKRWNTLDYYQLPDHLFVGPVGFIDPQSPANLDVNNDVIGNINPNAQFIGYETAGFPMFQDPFSNSDLSPFQAQSEEDLDNFNNRIS